MQLAGPKYFLDTENTDKTSNTKISNFREALGKTNDSFITTNLVSTDYYT